MSGGDALLCHCSHGMLMGKVRWLQRSNPSKRLLSLHGSRHWGVGNGEGLGMTKWNWANSSARAQDKEVSDGGIWEAPEPSPLIRSPPNGILRIGMQTSIGRGWPKGTPSLTAFPSKTLECSGYGLNLVWGGQLPPVKSLASPKSWKITQEFGQKPDSSLMEGCSMNVLGRC